MAEYKKKKFENKKRVKRDCYIFWAMLRGVPKRTEHGNRPIFSTEFGKIVHILADFGNRNRGTRKFSF